jgi:hypothetical protein
VWGLEEKKADIQNAEEHVIWLMSRVMGQRGASHFIDYLIFLQSKQNTCILLMRLVDAIYSITG